MLTTVAVIDFRCPECGSQLNGTPSRLWCSFVGDQRPAGREACDFGIAEPVALNDPRIVKIVSWADPAWAPDQQDDWNLPDS